jgi:hypothetical protein
MISRRVCFDIRGEFGSILGAEAAACGGTGLGALPTESFGAGELGL